ncbi:hypothetical protein WDU94_013284 [Cyamophila willieti]
MAADEVKSRQILTDLKFEFMPRDGACNDQISLFTAVESFYKDDVDVFFGPTCEYCVAPIARLVKFWNTPLLTTGAFTFDFTKNKTENSGEYTLLTRVSPMAFEGLTSVVIQILRRNSWKRVMLIYDKNGYKMLSGTHTCKLMMETLAEGLKKEKIHYANFDTEKNKGRSLKHNLKEEVGAMYGGE